VADIIDLTSSTGVPEGTVLQSRQTQQLVTVTHQAADGSIHYTPPLGDGDSGQCRLSAIAAVFELPPILASDAPDDEPMEVNLDPAAAAVSMTPGVPDGVTEYSRLTVDGKYTAILGTNGTIPVLRYGEPWIADIAQEVGGKFIMSALFELSAARERIAELEQLAGVAVPVTTHPAAPQHPQQSQQSMPGASDAG
jgi:hypothetical protein